MERMLIRSRFLLPISSKTGSNARIKDGYILTEGEYIKEVGKFTPKIGKRILDESDQLTILGTDKEVTTSRDIPVINGVALPGFVKAHGHDHESPIIGIAKDAPLTEWLDTAVNFFTGFLSERAESLTKELGRSPFLITYLKARLDDLSHGITTAVTHHCNFNKYYVDELVEANDIAGTKIVIAIGSQDRNYDPRILDTPINKAIQRLDEAYEKHKDNPHVKIIPGPDQLFSNSPELLKALKKWSIDHNTKIHIHSSEEPATTKWFVEKYGQTPIEYAESIGFLDQNTFVAHQVNCTEHDLEILEKRGVAVVHNPLANTILGSGMPPLLEFKKRNIRFAISTDGSGSADNQNIINAGRVASQYQKAYHKNARLFPAQEVIERITTIPAQIIGFNTGSLEPGKYADIAIIDLSKPNLIPTRLNTVVENVIWAANGNEISYVISNGKVCIDNYRFTTIDSDRLLKEVDILSQRLDEYITENKPAKATGIRSEENH